MEFFVWCWIWDRRLLCGLRRRALFIYLWFIPAVISFCVLPYSGIRYMDDMQNPKECDRISEVNDERQNLFLGVHLMQAMIVLTFFTSLGMIVQTKYVFRKLTKKQEGSVMTGESNYCDYLWVVREHSLRSVVGYTALVIGILNYLCSIAFIREYVIFTDLMQTHGLDLRNCEVESAWVITSYCCLFQVPLGSLCCLIFHASCCVKFWHAFVFTFCPLCLTRFKKTYNKIPRQFGHYSGEFSFECEENIDPIIEAIDLESK